MTSYATITNRWVQESRKSPAPPIQRGTTNKFLSYIDFAVKSSSSATNHTISLARTAAAYVMLLQAVAGLDLTVTISTYLKDK
jgi:hypothetical protein